MKKSFVIEKGSMGNGFKIDLAGVEIKNPVNMSYNFDASIPMGKCDVSLKHNGKTGDHYLSAKINYAEDIEDFYPAVGVQTIERVGDVITKSVLQWVALCPGPNVDETILCLKDQLKK